MTGLAKTSPITSVVATGIGAALFFVFGKFLAIPTPIPNTTLNIQYALLVVFAILYGPVVAALMGFIGHFLIDVSTFGPWWSWIIASAVVGLIVGLLCLRDKVQSDGVTTTTLMRFGFATVMAHAIAWVLLAPALDVLIYSEPAGKVFVQGLTAWGVNAVTSVVIGIIILIAYGKTVTKSGSLTLDQ